jgi:osmotically-inducible protein OsmY
MERLEMKSIVVIAAAAILAGGACVRFADGGATVGQQLDRVIARTNAALADTGNALAWSPAATDDAIAAFADTISDRALVRTLDVGNAGLSASIKRELVRDPELSGTRIDVESKDGVVLLSGEAAAHRHRERAEQIAWANRAVVRVENNVTVSGD